MKKFIEIKEYLRKNPMTDIFYVVGFTAHANCVGDSYRDFEYFLSPEQPNAYVFSTHKYRQDWLIIIIHDKPFNVVLKQYGNNIKTRIENIGAKPINRSNLSTFIDVIANTDITDYYLILDLLDFFVDRTPRYH